jgi:hypothetical protein
MPRTKPPLLPENEFRTFKDSIKPAPVTEINISGHE